jgi:hypothetical protein
MKIEMYFLGETKINISYYYFGVSFNYSKTRGTKKACL